MTLGETPVCTDRTGSQGLGITGAQDPGVAPTGAPAAPFLTGNGAHMGREKLPISEGVLAALEYLGRLVAEAVARGEFEHARALTEEAIRRRAGEASSPDSAPAREPAE
jgi:hypothetical protein